MSDGWRELVTSEHHLEGQGMKRERKREEVAFDAFSAINRTEARLFSIFPQPPNLSPSQTPPLRRKQHDRCTFVVEGFTYNYVVDGSFTFLAVSAER